MLTVNHIALIPRRFKALGEPRPAKSGGLVTPPSEAHFLNTLFSLLLAHSFSDPLYFVPS